MPQPPRSIMENSNELPASTSDQSEQSSSIGSDTNTPSRDDRVVLPSQTRLLDARLEAEKLKKIYQNDPRMNSFRVLVTGETGTGKTHLLRTARKPIHIDSFDPGGTLVLRDLIQIGDVVADTEYENEDAEAPFAYTAWSRKLEQRIKGKYFDSFGTYCLDSSTLWAMAIMNQVLKEDKRPGTAPKFTRDYVPQKVKIQNSMRKVLNLPCDVIITGHLQGVFESKIVEGEEVRILTGMRYMTTGQGVIILPLMFDELWTTLAKEKGSGTEYQLLTAKHGLYQAKTRIGRGVFSTFETPNIKELLKKAHWPSDDKPKLY